MNERSAPASAIVCPFVAFEDDRDRRSNRPDHRHRCFAETVPAPRALAHQEHYCLSSAFPTCSTFADWSQREAARAVEPADPFQPGSLAGAVDALEAPRPAARDWAAPPPWLEGRAPRGEQLGAFDGDGVAGAGPEDQASPGHAGSRADAERASSPPRDRAPDAADRTTGRRGTRIDVPEEEDAAGSMPAFLASRIGNRAPSGAPPGDAGTGARPGDGARSPDSLSGAPVARRSLGPAQARPALRSRNERREPSAPAWEHARRAEAYPTLRTRMGLPELPRLAMAAIALVVAAAVLFFLPTLLAGPSQVPGTTAPSAAPSAAATGTFVLPTPAAPTPTIYTVVANDTLSGIATKFGLTVTEILAANPQIKDPNKIAIGDRITIPPKSTPTSVAPAGGASPVGSSPP